MRRVAGSEQGSSNCYSIVNVKEYANNMWAVWKGNGKGAN